MIPVSTPALNVNVTPYELFATRFGDKQEAANLAGILGGEVRTAHDDADHHVVFMDKKGLAGYAITDTGFGYCA